MDSRINQLMIADSPESKIRDASAARLAREVRRQSPAADRPANRRSARQMLGALRIGKSEAAH
jgi:hypothetical protein